jgi:secreted PhoX family phosphatase
MPDNMRVQVSHAITAALNDKIATEFAVQSMRLEALSQQQGSNTQRISHDIRDMGESIMAVVQNIISRQADTASRADRRITSLVEGQE